MDGSRTSTPSPPRLESREPQLAAVQRGLLGDDREPEAGAVRAGVLAAGERLEQPLALVGRDAGAVVLDVDDELRRRRARARPRRCRSRAGRAARRCRAGCRRAGAGRPPSRRRCPRRRGRRARTARRGGACARRAPRASSTSPSSTGSRGRLSAASPRASACRPSSRWTMRSCSAVMSRDERVALLERQLGVAGERVELGAQRGQRRAQLVAGVGGEAPGRLERALGRRRSTRPSRASISLSAPASWRTSSGAPLLVGQRRREVLGAADAGGAACAAARAGAPRAWSAPRRRARSARARRAEQQHEPADAADALLDRRERAERSAAAGCRSRRP